MSEIPHIGQWLRLAKVYLSKICKGEEDYERNKEDTTCIAKFQ